jgi:hypothetical protein
MTRDHVGQGHALPKGATVTECVALQAPARNPLRNSCVA